MAQASGLWLLGYAGSAITAVTFLGVAAMLAWSLSRTKQWHRNPLGVGTLFLFTTCGGGHLIHTVQLSYLWLGASAAYGHAMRTVYSDWHMWLVDGATAAAGLWYWTVRRKFPDLVRGTAVYEDLRTRHKDALAIHDGVVQRIAHAQMALELDDRGEARVALHDAVVAQRRVQRQLDPEGTL